MDINKALEINHKVTLDISLPDKDFPFASLDAYGVLRWRGYDGMFAHTVSLEYITSNYWQPYPEEIRPENEGELWKYKCEAGETLWFMYRNGKGELRAQSENRTTSSVMGLDKPIHNQNGWKMVYSPDPETRERIREK